MQQAYSQRARPERHKSMHLLRLRKRLIGLLAKYPMLYQIVRTRWRRFKFLLLRFKWKILALGVNKDCYLDVRRKLYVSPREVIYCSLSEFDVSDGLGRVIKGDWDLSDKKFEDLDIAAAICGLLKGEIDWENTAFFKHAEEIITGGMILWGCETRKDLLARCRDLERLLESIRNQGYKSQEEMNSEGLNWVSRPSGDEVTIAIGRKGQLLFCNGAHRLAIAKALEIESIPVQVAVRHPIWMRFRRDVELYAKKNGGAIYQPALHPDLINMPSHHLCENRFEFIRQALISKGGKLLDIGANWGYFCHRFEELGFDCYAVEDFPENIYFLEYFKIARNRSFHIVGESILESDIVRNSDFAVVLALNIFHHFLKSNLAFDRFRYFLKRLHCNEMFFEPHIEGEMQLADAPIKLSPEQFTMFVAEECGFSQVKLLGSDNDGRNLYRLSK